jgi:RNA polymerase sigma factor (sigma-70 family)
MATLTAYPAEVCRERSPIGKRTLNKTVQVNLLPKVAAGEQPAVALCVERYGGLVWSIARKYLRDRAEAEDAVQEVFIAVWRAADRFDPAVASETTFIAMIARRRLIDRVRKIGRKPDESELGAVNEPMVETTDRLEVADEARIAAAALDELGEPQRTVLKLSIYDGLSHGDIAEKMDLPLGSVKTYIRRGLQKIREMLTGSLEASEVNS